MTGPSPRLSCLIPLFQSNRFFDIICDNIDAHLETDTEVLVSDRHGLDDSTDRLARRYAGEPRVRILALSDRADWVDNINSLILAARGRYFRIIPHDDTASQRSTLALAEALDRDAQAVLAYGVVRALDLDGNPRPERDQMNTGESSDARPWNPEDALSMMWQGRFAGAFKGVVRADAVRSRRLLIRKTKTLVFSERAWLFALCLTGPFRFVREAILIKRYHDGSTSSGWTLTAAVWADITAVMLDYCDDLIADPDLRAAARLSVSVHGEAMVAARSGGPPFPGYVRLAKVLALRATGRPSPPPD